MTYGQKLVNGTWIGYWGPLTTDGIFTCIATDYIRREKTSPSTLTYTNQTIDWILGLTLVGLGVAGTVYELKDNPPNATWEDVVEAVVNPLPWGTQWLLYPSLVDTSAGLSVAVQLIVDFLGDLDPSDRP
jgi:hypothetical protein